MKRQMRLLTISALFIGLLISPQVLYGSLRLNRTTQAVSNSIITGNISVRSASNGNIVLIVDSGVAAATDGVPDLVIRFAPKKKKAKYRNISFELQGAKLFLSDRRVAVISEDGHTWVSLGLESIRPDDPSFRLYGDRSADLPQTVRILKGYALQRQTVYKPDGGSALEINLEQSIIAERGKISAQDIGGDTDPEPTITCSGGGRGSTGCGYSCGGQSCSVSCGSGTYSCCDCQGGSVPRCNCLIN